MKECSICKKTLLATQFHKGKSCCAKCRSENRPVLDRLVSGAKYRAKLKGMDFDITKEFITELNDRQGGLCVYTKVPLNWEPGGGSQRQRSCPIDRASIDRIDSSKGYTRDNVQLVTDFTNRVKLQYTHAELVRFCKSVASSFK